MMHWGFGAGDPELGREKGAGGDPLELLQKALALDYSTRAISWGLDAMPFPGLRACPG